jgi:hypothetical protein
MTYKNGGPVPNEKMQVTINNDINENSTGEISMETIQKDSQQTATDGHTTHRSVSVDETDISKAGTGFLPFATMQLWEFDAAKKNPAPDFLMSVDKTELKILGFMYPLEEGEEISNFCLLKSTQTCCYGPKPQYNQYVLVEMNKKVKFERLLPIIVSGTFFIDPKPEDGYIYRMKGHSIETMGGEAAANTANNENQLSLDPSKIEELDISIIEKFIKTIDGKNTSELNETDFDFFKNYEGKTYKISGYLIGVLSRTKKNILVGKDYWDGCCTGTPPSLTNSIPVKLKKEQNIPQFWDNNVSYTGTLKVNRNASKWTYYGIITLEDSVRLNK